MSERQVLPEPEERDCPKGDHGPMHFYRNDPDDDRGDFYECGECGYSEDA